MENSDKYINKFYGIALGLVILTIFFPFIINSFFSDWAKSGTFGDTFGALNALFSGLAFAGVIVTILIQKSELENQRLELQLQRNEMQETRKEFLINRTTNLVYNQLDRFEKSISELTITWNNKNYFGNEAITFLDDNLKRVYLFEKTELQYSLEMRKITIEQLHLFYVNKAQIEKFALNSYNSIEVLKRLLFKTNLEIDELNDLKNLFFVNVGFITMGVIERISEIGENELKYLETSDYSQNNLNVGTTLKANIFLKSMKKFYNQKLDIGNFDELKKDWIESKGGNV